MRKADAISKSSVRLFSAACSLWRELYHKSSIINEKIIQNTQGETEEAIAVFERKDEDVC